MSEPIRNKKSEMIDAPTPQNTPSNAAPISSHAKEPGVPTISEEELDHAAAASILAKDPKMISLIQGRLGSLVGRSSGYVESLPAPVKRRVAALKGIQKEHGKLEAELQAEILALEKKYLGKYTPLYERRSEIVLGKQEPTDAEVTAGEADEEEAETPETPASTKPTTDEKTETENLVGIPEFWLSAMKNHPSMAELITDKDEAALKHLTDIRMEYLDRPGFRLMFNFAPNDFFSNKTITKTYFYQEESGYGGDFIYSHAEGDQIQWAADKDLTVKIETKKQRNKNTKQTRVIKKSVPQESFFNFFTPPVAPAEDDEEDDVDEDIEDRLELDYTIGEDIKEKLIPRAVDWFTGEALQYEEVDDEFDEEDDEDEDDDEDDDDDEDEDEDESDEEEDASKPKPEAQECKQS